MTDQNTTTDESFPTTRRRALAISGATLAGLTTASGTVSATGPDGEGRGRGSRGRRYRVTVANLTDGQFFTPAAVAIHDPSVEVFAVGDPANEATREIAENGNLGPLAELIETTDEIRAAAVGDAPLVPSGDPGDTGFSYTTELELAVSGERGPPQDTPAGEPNYLSFIAMLIATNDGFTGLDTVALPEAVNQSHTYFAASYDAGTEENTERWADIVPPAQALSGMEADAPGTAEPQPELDEDGVVAPHPGISGDGDLDPEFFDWDDPVALVQVERTE